MLSRFSSIFSRQLQPLNLSLFNVRNVIIAWLHTFKTRIGSEIEYKIFPNSTILMFEGCVVWVLTVRRVAGPAACCCGCCLSQHCSSSSQSTPGPAQVESSPTLWFWAASLTLREGQKTELELQQLQKFDQHQIQLSLLEAPHRHSQSHPTR